jgi:REP element-mobilizing transposase RayT
MIQGIKHTIKKNTSYYITLTVVEWIDVFTRKNHKDAIINSLRYCHQKKGLNIYAFCLMTNHIHMIVNCNEPFQLDDVIRDFKRHTVKTIINQIKSEPESRRDWMMKLFIDSAEESHRNKNIKFWKTGNHAIELYSERFVWEKINYIHNNPVKGNFVKEPYEWIYSSASNYFFGEGILNEVHCLEQMLMKIK